MQSVTANKHRSSNRFSLPGMLLMLVAGIGAAIVAGLIAYVVSEILRFGIPMMYPAFFGITAHLATMKIGSGVGRCRNRTVAISVAVIAAIVAWGSVHLIDYARFRWITHRDIISEHPQAVPQEIDLFIDYWLHEETGQSGFAGFMLLKVSSESIELTPMQSGAAIGSFQLTGLMLVAYWFAEVLVAASLAGYMSRSYSSQPYCDECNNWRKFKTPWIGSVEQVDQAVEAFQRRRIIEALKCLGTHSEGDFARLEIEFCPVCYADSCASLTVVQDVEENTVWADNVDAAFVQELLRLTDRSK